MAAKETDQEPSIEEILSSIRQIISDDTDEGTAAPTPPEAPVVKNEPPAPIEIDDVLDLTQRIDEPPAEIEVDLQDFSPEPEPVREAMVDLSQQKETPPPAPKIERMESAVADDTIFTKSAAEAALNGFSELARKTAVEYNGITLEEIVRTELKPMLREWLDRHLPSLIERLVQEELESISKRVLEE